MHPDRDNMEVSLKHIRDVATNVNESIRATEQSKKMAEQTGKGGKKKREEGVFEKEKKFWRAKFSFF